MFEGGILGILFTSLQVYVFVGTEYKNLTEVHNWPDNRQACSIHCIIITKRTEIEFEGFMSCLIFDNCAICRTM